jgi:hypothetical protein
VVAEASVEAAAAAWQSLGALMSAA